MSMRAALRIVAVRLVCRNIDATLAFYEEAFGCRQVAANGSDAAVKLGDQRLEFVLAAADDMETTLAASNSTAFQHCAIVVSNMTVAMAHLRSVEGWAAISSDGPEKLPEASGAVTALKFRDPEGHPLELLEFPVDRLPDYWAQVAERADKYVSPCLGIDHSAITVNDTKAAIDFYEGLGFTVSSQQTNRGPEQARMDGVHDPVVEVTGLKPPGGAPPHLELLCYRHPPVFAERVRAGSFLATAVVLGRADGRTVALKDPDGHRLLETGHRSPPRSRCHRPASK